MSAFGSIRDSRGAAFAVGLTGAHLLLTLGGVLRHEMWRDETQAWLLARDSASVLELLANTEFEGHPVLWHLLLFALSRLGSDPLLMQLAHVGIAATGVYVLARHAPFGRLQKCLLAFGYFGAYEYAVVSRGYALGVLLVFVFCALHARRDDPAIEGDGSTWRALLPFVVLAALANTSVHGLLLSAALSISLLWPEDRGRAGRGRRPDGLGAAVLVTAWTLCFLQVGRIGGASAGGASGSGAYVVGEPLGSDPGLVELAAHVSRGLSHVWRGYVPVPSFRSEHPWDSNLLFDLDTGLRVAGEDASRALVLLGSVALVALACRLLASRPRWLSVYASGTAALLGFELVFLVDSSVRHHGHLFVLLVACLWLARAEAVREPVARADAGAVADIDRRARRDVRRQGALLTALLVPQVVAGLTLHALDWSRPFSGSRAAAELLRERALDDLPIIAYRDRETSTLSAYLDRPLYYPGRDAHGSYWTTLQEDDWDEARRRIARFVGDVDGPSVLALNRPLVEPIAGVAHEVLGVADGALVRRENLYLYLVVAR